MPVMGNAYAEEDGKPQRVSAGSVSLGLAVDVERKDGSRSLVVPVLHGASEMDSRTSSAATTSSSWARATTPSSPLPIRAPTSP